MIDKHTNHHYPVPAHLSSEEVDLLQISIIIPVYNEVENVPMIYQRITEILKTGPLSYKDSYEIIFVDDGSNDGSFQRCADIQKQDDRVRVLQFRRNFGKTAALHAGFSISKGQNIITIDADMQEDPADMFRLLEQIEAGYDLVSAWRKKRNDPASKTIPSRIFNTVVSRVTGVYLHDFNCGFKAYTRQAIDELQIYGEQHRFIPILAHQRGFRVTEVAVEHKPRRFGKSKFGFRRLGRGYLDFIQVLFLTKYLQRPLRLFGTIGSFFLILGLIVCLYLSILWLQGQRPIGDRPLLTLGILLVITGLQFVSTGLVGEMVRYNSYRSGDEYSIRCILETQSREDTEN